MAVFLHDDEILVASPTAARSPVVPARHPASSACAIADDGAGRVAYCTRPTYGERTGAPRHRAEIAPGGVTLLRLDRAGGAAREGALALDSGDQPACALFHGDVLYVAGRRIAVDTEKRYDVAPFLCAWDLAARPRPVRVDVALPSLEDKEPGKRTIDALVVDGGRLLAVDNVMIPIYVFVLDLADPRRPAPIEARELTMGIWGRVSHVALSSRFLVLLETEGTRMGPIFTVALRDRVSWRPCASMSVQDRCDQGPMVGFSYRGIAVVDDVLFIATGTEGLGRVDLRELTDLAEPGPERYVGRSYEVACERLRRRVTYTKAFGDGVHEVRAEGDVCVVLEASGERAHAVG
jgi:hypothetical protein